MTNVSDNQKITETIKDFRASTEVARHEGWHELTSCQASLKILSTIETL